MTPPITRCPLDLLYLFFESCATKDLLALSVVNRAVSHVAYRHLYRSITLDLDPMRLKLCMRTLSSEPKLANLIQSLVVNWQRGDPPRDRSFLLKHHGQNLKSFLKCLRYLCHLDLNLCILDVFGILADDTYPFQLTWFSTSLIWDDGLTAFLNNQPRLRVLRLNSICELDEPPQGLGHLCIRAFHWGPEVSAELIATVYQQAETSLQEIHGDLSDTLVSGSSALNTVRSFQGKARFILRGPIFDHFSLGQFAFSHLSILISECDLNSLYLTGYPRLQSLVCIFTGSNRSVLTTAEKCQTGVRWFRECPSLQRVTIEDGGSHEDFFRESSII